MLIEPTASGLHCAAGGFHIDPWAPVERAVITHAHGDHLRPGSGAYLCTRASHALLAHRLGSAAAVTAVAHGEAVDINGVRVSLHPAGHILGSAQVRVEYKGEVWVASGDYKRAPDPTCDPFEPVRCHTFITEATFALPLFRWDPPDVTCREILAWWDEMRDAGRAAVLFGYALGKAQRVLSGLDPSIGPIFTHGAVERMTGYYRDAGIQLPPTSPVGTAPVGTEWSRAMVVAPPAAGGSGWMRRFAPYSTGFVSGWMRVRGARRRRAVDRGFALSDHADWPALLATIDATGAEQVWVTHGFTAVMTRWLEEHGRKAQTVATYWEGEQDDAPVEEAT